MNLLQNFHLAVIEYLYRKRRAIPLFTTRHSNRKLSIVTVMALSTTFKQCAPETTEFGRITHFAVQGHSRSPILVQIESPDTASYIKKIASQNWIYESARNLYRGRRAVSLPTFRPTTRHSNRKLSIVMALSTTFMHCTPKTTKFGKITQN